MVYYHGREVIVYYVSEPSEGTDPASPVTWKVLGQLVDKEFIYDPEPVQSLLTGDVDPADQKYGISNPIIRISLEVDDADGKAFLLAYHNTDTTFQIALRAKDGTIMARLKGGKLQDANFMASVFSGSMSNYRPCTLDLTVEGIDLAFTAPAGMNNYNDPSGTFLSFSDITVQRDGSTVTDWWDAGFRITYRLIKMPTFNTGTGRWEVATIKRGDRTVVAMYSQPSQVAESADYAAARAGTKINVTILIGTQTWTFGNSLMKEFAVRSPRDGMHGKRFQWSPTTITTA